MTAIDATHPEHPQVAERAGAAGALGRGPSVAFLVVGTAIIAAYELIADPTTRDLVYLALGTGGAAAIAVAVRRNRPVLALPWYLMAGGQLLWVIGDALYTWLEHVPGGVPFPSVADVFYLAAYPVILLGVHLLLRGRSRRRDLASLVDSAIVTAGLGLLSWVTLAQPTIAVSQESTTMAAVAVAYPLGDILLVGGLMRLVTAPGARSMSLQLLLAAISVLVVADSLFLALSLFGSGDSYRLDWLWLASYLLWGAAALHPSMTTLSRPAPDAPDVDFRRGRLVAMTGAALIAPAVLATQALMGMHIDVTAIVMGSVLIILLVVTRMRLAIDQIATAKAALEHLQEELTHTAAHDSLTGLANRSQALPLLHAALSRAQRRGDLVAVLFVDLDGFKTVNDTQGHPAGDEVLRAVARELRSVLRAGDTAVRLGGDEFVVVLDPVEDEAAAIGVAQRIIAALAEPIPISTGATGRIGASVGVACNHDPGTDPDTLLTEADIAVYKAKAGGRGRVEVFNRSLGEEVARRAELEGAIAQAIAQDELEVHYQPVFDLRTRHRIGHEALARWQRPGLGLLGPADFIPAAEACDLICELDTWVLERAIRQLAAWNAASGSRHLTMSVNLSGRHVNSGRAVDHVRDVLARHDVDAGQVVLEITETVPLHAPIASHRLDQLRGLGVALSLDDFGTGYSSLAQLTRLPLDQVKIDRSYLAPGTSSALFELIVRAAHAAGLRVVAEGVELPEQLVFLEQIGVEAAQGYLLGRPTAATDLGTGAWPGPSSAG